MRLRLILLLIALFFLNIADAICTWISVCAEMAYEINPFANHLISQGPVIFFGTKILLIALVILFTFLRLKEPRQYHINVFVVLVCMYTLIVLVGIISVTLTYLSG